VMSYARGTIALGCERQCGDVNSWIINEKSEFCARANAHAKFWTPLAQNPEFAPGTIALGCEWVRVMSYAGDTITLGCEGVSDELRMADPGRCRMLERVLLLLHLHRKMLLQDYNRRSIIHSVCLHRT